MDGVVDANIEQQMERPQLDVRPRREMLAYYGIPMSEFADYIGVAMAGEVVSQVYEDGFPVNLTLRVEPDARNTIESINSLMIDSQKGKIPLSAVADVVSTSGPNAVNRENVSRRIVVSANVDGRDLRGVVEDIQREIEENVDLPALPITSAMADSLRANRLQRALLRWYRSFQSSSYSFFFTDNTTVG